MIFKKGGTYNDMNFKYKNVILEIVNEFKYLGIKFTTGVPLKVSMNYCMDICLESNE